MDTTDILDSNNTNGEASLVIDGPIREFLTEAARWAKFLSILGFVFLGLGLLSMLAMGGLMASSVPELGVMGFVWIPAYLITVALSVLPLIYLYRFATKMQLALIADDQTELQASFRTHKSFFKFYGIAAIIVIGFYVLIMIFALFTGLSTAF